MKICGFDTSVGIWGLKHAYVFQKYNFLNTAVENRTIACIKI